MPRPGKRRGAKGRAAGAGAACLLLALAGATPALAAKGKKKKVKNPAVTAVAAVPMSAGSTQTATASCTGKTHATGGGFSVAPSHTPPATGLRTLNVTSGPAGNKAWTAVGHAYSTPAAAGAFTAYGVCESNRLGRIAIRATSTLTISPGAGQNMVFNCPPATHAIAGGYAGTGLGAFTFQVTSHRIVVLQSRRTGPGQWTISAFNNPASPAAASLTGYAVCEVNAKGSAVSEVSSFAPLTDNARTVADASCAKKQHVVSGGFLVSPATFPGTVPLVGIDENQPVGKRGWHIGLWEYPTALPPGSALQTTAYCKRG